jgi:hypothetical protein
MKVLGQLFVLLISFSTVSGPMPRLDPLETEELLTLTLLQDAPDMRDRLPVLGDEDMFQRVNATLDDL